MRKTTYGLCKELAQKTVFKHTCCEDHGIRVGKRGYPEAYFPRRLGKRASYTVGAHRLVCEFAHGPCPPNKIDAAHSCGNPKCLNPNHLYWASRKENNDDRRKHGTLPYGATHQNSKLTEKQVDAIRKDTRIRREIAADYGVGRRCIDRIKTGARWGLYKNART